LESLSNILKIGIDKFLIEDLKETPAKDDSKKIEKEIIKTEKMINNLIDRLALVDEDMIESIKNRISDLINKKKELQEKLLIFEQRKKFNSIKKDNTKTLNNTIKNFMDKFNYMNMDEKQLEIRKIIKYVKWDGKSQKFAVKLINI